MKTTLEQPLLDSPKFGVTSDAEANNCSLAGIVQNSLGTLGISLSAQNEKRFYETKSITSTKSALQEALACQYPDAKDRSERFEDLMHELRPVWTPHLDSSLPVEIQQKALLQEINKLSSKLKSRVLEWLLQNTGKTNYWEIIQDLEQAGCKLNSLQGQRAFSAAAMMGHINVLKPLIVAKIDVNEKNGSGRNPLYDAVSRGFFPSVDLLLKAGADPHIVDNRKGTILQLAARVGSVEIVNSLIALNVELDAQDEDGYTALHWAAHYGHTAIILKLKEFGADTHIKSHVEEVPLFRATRMGRVDAIDKLCEINKNDVHEKNIFGLTPLHVAAGLTSNIWCIDTLDLLLEKGSDPNALDLEDNNPLHLASSHGFSKAVDRLIVFGSDSNKQNRQGDLPLHHAAVSCSKRSVELLLKVTLNPATLNHEGKTALHSAISKSEETIDPLARVIDINIQDNNGETALHAAARLGFKTSLLKLLTANESRKIQFDLKDKDGRTAKEAALFHGHTTIAEILGRYENV